VKSGCRRSEKHFKI